MKVLMIGGTGQLGHFVLKHLARGGHATERFAGQGPGSRESK
jgi:hypothetical protein